MQESRYRTGAFDSAVRHPIDFRESKGGKFVGHVEALRAIVSKGSSRRRSTHQGQPTGRRRR